MIKNIFITGTTGTLGQEVLKQLRGLNFHVSGLTRDEHKLKHIINKYVGLEMYLGDIRDVPLLRSILKQDKPDIVFHFAALKHVDLCEDHKHSCMETNFKALEGLGGLCYEGGIKLVLTSTDKAAYPINTYGLSKALGEKFVFSYGDNVVCRYGNVLASNGSVVHLFKEKIEKGEIVPITHKDMTRFWISIKDAAGFVIKSAFDETGGLKIPTMKAYNVEALARLIAKYLGKPIDIKYVGLRAGEKIHECLATKYDKGYDKDIFSNEVMYSEAEMLELIKEVL